jgi:hypothetical protein
MTVRCGIYEADFKKRILQPFSSSAFGISVGLIKKMDTMKVQSQIRQNAEEVSSYLSDMSKWEKNANRRVLVKKSSTNITKALPVRLGSGTVKVIEKVPVTDTMGASMWMNPIADTISLDSRAEPAGLTPASLVTSLLSPMPSLSAVPAARGVANLKDAETSERERGNTEFEVGNFAAAIKCYSKCLGLKVPNTKRCRTPLIFCRIFQLTIFSYMNSDG